jgi:hypothetical protein
VTTSTWRWAVCAAPCCSCGWYVACSSSMHVQKASVVSTQVEVPLNVSALTATNRSAIDVDMKTNLGRVVSDDDAAAQDADDADDDDLEPSTVELRRVSYLPPLATPGTSAGVDAITSLDVSAPAGAGTGGVWVLVGHRSGHTRLLYADVPADADVDHNDAHDDDDDDDLCELVSVKQRASVHTAPVLRVAFLAHDHERFLSLDSDGLLYLHVVHVSARTHNVDDILSTRTHLCTCSVRGLAAAVSLVSLSSRILCWTDRWDGERVRVRVWWWLLLLLMMCIHLLCDDVTHVYASIEALVTLRVPAWLAQRGAHTQLNGGQVRCVRVWCDRDDVCCTGVCSFYHATVSTSRERRPGSILHRAPHAHRVAVSRTGQATALLETGKAE